MKTGTLGIALPNYMTQQPGSGPEFNFGECSRRIAMRDSAAEDAFVRFFQARIFAYAQRNLRQLASVEEIVQETLWAAIRALRDERLEDSANLSAFVYGIARNKVADARRRAAKDPLEPWPEGFDPPTSAESPSEELRRKEATAAIQELPPAEQSVLRMMLVEGLPSSEIADKLNLTEMAVRQRKSRALKRIADRIRSVAGARP
jgi:RNA polymerase sigma-70 factor (ECF subfamily)